VVLVLNLRSTTQSFSSKVRLVESEKNRKGETLSTLSHFGTVFPFLEYFLGALVSNVVFILGLEEYYVLFK
jgi:hypothetical protein